jgi:hypothetical protein
MDVLIGFVTQSDPWQKEEEGPASIVTAARALCPGYIYLLYSESTQENAKRTREFLEKSWFGVNPKLPSWHKLELPNPTDYNRLKETIPDNLMQIKRSHPGARFHLVGGLAQARMTLGLCLSAGVINGICWEVERPNPKEPWPHRSEGYQSRLKEVDPAFFHHFRELFMQQFKRVRLRLDTDQHRAELLDQGKTMPLDLRAPDGHFRTFAILALLAARKCYGGGQDHLYKRDLKRTVFKDIASDVNQTINIPRDIRSINKQAKEWTRETAFVLDPLIAPLGKGSVMCYQLTDALDPGEETIDFRTSDLRGFIRRYFTEEAECKELFPHLF